MAKSEPKTTPATEPTIAPPPIVASPPDSAPSPDDVVTEPEIATPASSLPNGVAMQAAGEIPRGVQAKRDAPDPRQPPPGYKGSFSRCGGCGDFLGNADRCLKCGPSVVPSNIMNENRGPRC